MADMVGLMEMVEQVYKEVKQCKVAERLQRGFGKQTGCKFST